MLQSILAWISVNHTLIAVVSLCSVVLFACSLMAAPWIIAQLPTDYFTQQRHYEPKKGIVRWVIWLFRNVLGILLILVGLIMFITPGPGLLVCIAGLSACDFSKKRQTLMSLAKQPRVFDSLNWMRQKSAKPPFHR